MLRIALPNKGRLSDDARELFADAGLEVRSRGERALTAALGDSFEANDALCRLALEELVTSGFDHCPPDRLIHEEGLVVPCAR